MPITPLPIANGFYVSNSLPISAQECTNLFPHLPGAPSLAQETLLGTPGVYQVATTGNSITDACRGAYVFSGEKYFVNGTTLWRLNSDNSLSNLGTINGTREVSIADNGSQMMILVPGEQGYIFTTSPDILTEITDTDFRANGNPLYTVFIDGYFVSTTDAKKFIISDLNDGLSYNALDFGSAESSPDAVVVPFVYKNQLIVGGERSMEVFSNVGGAEFPFQRTGLFFEEGVIAPFSVVQGVQDFYFIGAGEKDSPSVWQLSGNSTQKVSTVAIDSILQRLEREQIEQVSAWAYGQDGHSFVGFELPTTTLVYDVSTGRWHERSSRIPISGQSYERKAYRSRKMISVGGLIYCGDTQDGRIGIIDPDVYSEYGNQILRQFATQPFQNHEQHQPTP